MASAAVEGKQKIKSKLKFSDWITRQLQSAGRTQLEIAKEAGFRPEDLTKWKKGQAVPEMNNLLRLAHYFDEDPEKLFKIAGKPELVKVYRLFLPMYQKKQLSEEDLYKNRKHAELHRRMQTLLLHGYYERFQDDIRVVEEEHYFDDRVDELIRLTDAEDGWIFHCEIDFTGGVTLLRIPYGAPKLDRHNLPKGWVEFIKQERRGDRGVEVQLVLKNPKMQPFIKKLIEVYMRDWLKRTWPDATLEES